MGATSCAASACHGGDSTDDNQFTLWSIEDRHSKAYEALFKAKSKLMTNLLRQNPAPQNEFCLDCHATNAQAHKRGPKFDLHDGVGCESCHGAASQWLEPHSREGWTHAQNVKMGMSDLKNMQVRADTCIHCHSGLSHEVLAAGHPELTFELDTFSALMPRHWKEKERWEGARAWIMGQVTLLDESLKSFGAHSQKRGFPDEEALECVACHHNLFDTDYELTHHSTGYPRLNLAHWVALQPVASRLFPKPAQELEGVLKALDEALQKPKKNLDDIIHHIQKAQKLTAQIRAELPGVSFTAPEIQEWMKGIASSMALRSEAFRSAEQAVLALDSLHHSLKATAKGNDLNLNASLQKLYEALNVKDPSLYHREGFVLNLEKVAQKLGASPPLPISPEDQPTPLQNVKVKTLPPETNTWWERVKTWFK